MVGADCATGFDDMVADALGLHMCPNGFSFLVAVLFAIGGVILLVMSVELKGSHLGILRGLGGSS